MDARWSVPPAVGTLLRGDGAPGRVAGPDGDGGGLAGRARWTTNDPDFVAAVIRHGRGGGRLVTVDWPAPTILAADRSLDRAVGDG